MVINKRWQMLKNWIQWMIIRWHLRIDKNEVSLEKVTGNGNLHIFHIKINIVYQTVQFDQYLSLYNNIIL